MIGSYVQSKWLWGAVRAVCVGAVRTVCVGAVRAVSGRSACRVWAQCVPCESAMCHVKSDGCAATAARAGPTGRLSWAIRTHEPTLTKLRTILTQDARNTRVHTQILAWACLRRHTCQRKCLQTRIVMMISLNIERRSADSLQHGSMVSHQLAIIHTHSRQMFTITKNRHGPLEMSWQLAG